MTGWADTWMMSSHAKHPNCMYKWMAWMITPEGPGRGRRVLRRGAGQPEGLHDPRQDLRSYASRTSAPLYHVNDQSYYNAISFWKTPLADCGDSRGKTCVDYSEWTTAWTEIKG